MDHKTVGLVGVISALTPVATAITGQQNLIHSVHVTILNEPFPAN